MPRSVALSAVFLAAIILGLCGRLPLVRGDKPAVHKSEPVGEGQDPFAPPTSVDPRAEKPTADAPADGEVAQVQAEAEEAGQGRGRSVWRLRFGSRESGVGPAAMRDGEDLCHRKEGPPAGNRAFAGAFRPGQHEDHGRKSIES